jgi:COP9 signalosome complex subunit 1
MAFFDREELKTRLLDNSEFKTYLELEPHIREAAQAFFSARYSVTLGILERHRPDFIVDIFLSPHVELLYKEIRQKALVRAFYPYSTLELSTLSSLFSTSVSELAAEVVQLIEDGKIDAKLDCQKMVVSPIINADSQVLVSRHIDQRSVVFQTSLKMASQYEKSAHELLLNMKLAQAELEVRPAQKDGKDN